MKEKLTIIKVGGKIVEEELSLIHISVGQYNQATKADDNWIPPSRNKRPPLSPDCIAPQQAIG